MLRASYPFEPYRKVPEELTLEATAATQPPSQECPDCVPCASCNLSFTPQQPGLFASPYLPEICCPECCRYAAPLELDCCCSEPLTAQTYGVDCCSTNLIADPCTLCDELEQVPTQLENGVLDFDVGGGGKYAGDLPLHGGFASEVNEIPSFIQNQTETPSVADPLLENLAAPTTQEDILARCLWSTCSASFRTLEEVIPHLTETHENLFTSTSARCVWNDCDLTFDVEDTETRQNFVDHICQEHLGVAASTFHTCMWENCGWIGESFDRLTAHVSECHVGKGKAEYVCLWRDCERKGRSFNQRQKIMRHVQTHTGDKPFECPICHKRFSEPAVMQQHARTHTGEKPFKCPEPYCDRDFSLMGALKIHQRTHTGDKPYLCSYPGCNKRFAESSNLTKHRRTHSGIKPFSCPVESCGKEFARPDQLKRHQKVHAVKMKP